MKNSKFYTNVEVWGSTVLVREIVDGIPSLRKDQWNPTLYVKGKPKDVDSEKFVSLYGEDVYSIQPGTIPECRDFVKRYEDVSGFEIFGQLNYALQYMNEYKSIGWEYKQMSAWSIDIETTIPVDAEGNTYFPSPKNVDGEINLITMTDMHNGRCFTFGSKPYSGKDTQYTYCANEAQLLTLFLQFWDQKKVDIITGWNIAGFDLPYIYNRITRILDETAVKKLSPWGKVSCKEKMFMGNLEFDIRIAGVSVLDYIDLYKKYIFVKQESYSLGHIAMEELGHTKLDTSAYGSFMDMQKNAWQEAFVPYNVIDALLIKQLDDKLRLIELVLTMAYEANVNYEDVASPVKTWDACIANYCLNKGIVLPQQAHEESLPLDGAYVKEPVPGWYKNVITLDAQALYPSIIMTNNISPETWLGNCGSSIDEFLAGNYSEVDKDTVVTPTGAMYSKKTRGILPELVIYYMKIRREAKNEMLRLQQVYEDTKEESLPGKIAALDSKQQAVKLFLNSLYGALANKYFRFFKHDHASSITLTGQYVLRTIESKLDDSLNEMFKTNNVKYLIYIDTDSLLITLDEVIKKYKIPEGVHIKTLETLAKEKVSDVINKFCNECCGHMNSFENKLFFKLEIAADKVFFCLHPASVIDVSGVTTTIEEYYNSHPVIPGSTKSFNSHSMKLVDDIVSAVHRKKYSGKMYKFFAENGKSVTVTEDHVMFVIRDGLVMEIEAKNVILTDELIYFGT